MILHVDTADDTTQLVINPILCNKVIIWSAGLVASDVSCFVMCQMKGGKEEETALTLVM